MLTFVLTWGLNKPIFPIMEYRVWIDDFFSQSITLGVYLFTIPSPYLLEDPSYPPPTPLEVVLPVYPLEPLLVTWEDFIPILVGRAFAIGIHHQLANILGYLFSRPTLLCSFLGPISAILEPDLQVLRLFSPALTQVISFYAMRTLQILGMGGCTWGYTFVHKKKRF